jgi:hypothetical protein
LRLFKKEQTIIIHFLNHYFIMEQIAKLKELIASAEADAEKFNKGNNAAGTRLRNTMQQLKVTAQEVRTAVTEKKNTK